MISVIVPAYNEGPYISGLLDSLNEYDVIVVDDGSTDGTADILKNSSGTHNYVVLEKNSGKGFACLTGIEHSKGENVIFIDGDGQLSPDDIPSVAAGLTDADIVIGERSADKIPWQRRISNRFAAACVNYITGYDFSDVLCGMRGVRKRSFRQLDFKKLGYYFESEMLLLAHERGIKIKSVPVDVDYKTGSRMSVTKSLRVAVWLLGSVLKTAAKRFVGSVR